MKEVSEMIKRYKQSSKDLIEAEKLAADIRSRKYKIQEEICNYWRDNRLGEINIDGLEINAKYEQKYNIKGGEKSTDKRTEFLTILEEMGYGEKIKTFKSVHAKTLNSIIKNMPVELIQSIISKGYISVYDYPSVDIKDA